MTAPAMCPACLSARAKYQRDMRAARAAVRKTARLAREQHAIDDAKLLHEIGGAPLDRAAKLAAAYHKSKWSRVYRALRTWFEYTSGRPARLRKAA